MSKLIRLYIGFSVFLFSCSDDSGSNTNLQDSLYEVPKETILKTGKEFYSINPLTQDSIQPVLDQEGNPLATGIPVKLSGNINFVENFEAPQITKAVPYDKIPSTSAHPNGVRAYDAFQTIQINKDSLGLYKFDHEDYYLINQLGDTLKTGVSQPTMGNTSTLNYPTAVKSAPMRQKITAPAGIRYIGADQGLSSTYVLDIFNDSRGNLWFANWITGISKYDGNSLWHYGNESGLSGTNTRSISEDTEGNLWIGTWGEGISKFNGKSFTNYGVNEGLAQSTIWTTFADSKGAIWFSETYGGLTKFHNESLTHYTPNEGLGSVNVRSIIEDKDGQIWIGSMGGGVSRIEGNKVVNVLTEDAGLLSNDVRSIFFDSKDNLWVGTLKGLSMFDGEKIHNLSSSFGDNFVNIQGIEEDLNGNLWFASEKNGLTKYDGEYFTVIGKDQGLTDQEIWSIAKDNAGNMWLATNDGVNHFYTGSFENFTEQRGLANNVVWSIMCDSKNRIWMGLTGYGVSVFDGHSVKTISSEHGLPGSKVTELYEANNGDIWMGMGRNGAAKYNGDQFVHFGSKNGLTDTDVWDIIEDKNGDMWFATDGAGIFKYNGNSFTQYSEENGFPSNYVYNFYEDTNKDLWIGTWGGGIVYYNFDTFTFYTEKEGLSSNRICDITQDQDNNYWFVTEDQGVMQLKNDTITYFSEEHGLSSNAGASIEIDKNNNLWVSSSDGLSLLSPTNSNYNIKQFKNQDGLNSVSFLTGAATLDTSNQLWWGTGKGAVHLQFKNNKSINTELKVQLNEIEINEKTYNFIQPNSSDSLGFSYETSPAFYNYPKKLKLEHHLNHLTFSFSAIDWNAPHKIKYSHRIKDLNSSWSKPNHETRADYRNIPFGKHIFSVKAINETGSWSQPFEFEFEIYPPWWHSWWARTIYALLGLMILLLIIRLRTAKLKKKQADLEKKIELATHEITEQHNEIMDSIAYAKRIQTAILPPTRIVKEYLKNSFILYKPKDIVAGDFYWMEQKNGDILFAAADCTGHGVPGAMVSVICNNALNRAVREYNLADPGKILDKAREIVIQEFEKSDEVVKDGMDIALCSLNGMNLKYAGANNPLWILRNGEILETKANKQPIGQFDKPQPYTTHEFQLQPGDTFYIFSDGLVDQFGGEKGKKFKAKAFRELLIGIQNKTVQEQEIIINNVFEEWRGSIEQIDDVCVIGVRV